MQTGGGVDTTESSYVSVDGTLQGVFVARGGKKTNKKQKERKKIPGCVRVLLEI